MHARLVWDRSQVDGPRHDWRSRSDAQTGVAVNGPDTPAPDVLCESVLGASRDARRSRNGAVLPEQSCQRALSTLGARRRSAATIVRGPAGAQRELQSGLGQRRTPGAPPIRA
jgi:hypothetical protein